MEGEKKSHSVVVKLIISRSAQLNFCSMWRSLFGKKNCRSSVASAELLFVSKLVVVFGANVVQMGNAVVVNY